jgi:ABC-type transport system involved in multi-copper enzyme maturation permease subunit
VFFAVYHIAKNTFRESLREPVYLLILMLAMVLISSTPWFSMFVFREQVKLVTDSAMASVLVFGLVTAVLCASRAVSREIENGTALLLLSKPVMRPVFLLAKILGITGALTVFWFILSLVSLVSIRVAADQFFLDYRVLFVYILAVILAFVVAGVHNFVTRSSFPMMAVLFIGGTMAIATVVIAALPVRSAWLPPDADAGGLAYETVPALFLILFAVWAMGTIATALSTRLKLIPNMLACSALFVVGLMSDWLIGRFADSNPVAALLYAAVPNWQLLWMADALTAKVKIPLGYMGLAVLYIFLFMVFFSILASLLFSHREVGEQNPG